MSRCIECKYRVTGRWVQWSNGLPYCPACMKKRTKRIAKRQMPGAIQKGSIMAGQIVFVDISGERRTH